MSTERPPTTVVLFHSMFGLRPLELRAAERLRARGFVAVTPDLYDGAVAAAGHVPAAADGFTLMAAIGWETIVGRARAAMRDLPPEAVLCGISMGAGVVGALWQERPDAAAVILLHAVTTVPSSTRSGTPVQVHIAEDDPIAPAGHLLEFRRSARRADVDAALFTYSGAGHLFTDRELPDSAPAAAATAWRRVDALLDAVR